jgi:TetR/AcrR family transcriptional regulator, mexJK operon transcriptional repressor
MPKATDSLPADCRKRLLAAATEVFMAEGYRASIERIACRAGVARQTLYNHFPSKELLFEAVVGATVQSVVVTLEAKTGDLRASLLSFATVYREKILNPGALAACRTLIAEAPRFAGLARNFLAAGPESTVGHVARFLARAMERGELRSDDPQLAAEVLTGMLTGYERLNGLLNGGVVMTDNSARTGRIVDVFLRAYRSERGQT